MSSIAELSSAAKSADPRYAVGMKILSRPNSEKVSQEAVPRTIPISSIFLPTRYVRNGL